MTGERVKTFLPNFQSQTPAANLGSSWVQNGCFSNLLQTSAQVRLRTMILNSSIRICNTAAEFLRLEGFLCEVFLKARTISYSNATAETLTAVTAVLEWAATSCLRPVHHGILEIELCQWFSESDWSVRNEKYKFSICCSSWPSTGSDYPLSVNHLSRVESYNPRSW